MRKSGFVLASLIAVTAAAGSPGHQKPYLQVLGTYHTGIYEQGAAEIVAYDSRTRRVFVVNAAATTVDVLDIRNPSAPALVATIDASALGSGANSVAVKDGLVAVAIQAAVKTDPGLVAVYDSRTLQLLRTFPAGALPDMVTFASDGSSLVVANEGEPNEEYSVDPEGSVTYIDLQKGLKKASVHQIRFASFEAQRGALLAEGVRLFGPNASVAQDLEPEYLAYSADGKFVYATLQENNALAKISLRDRKVTAILPLGSKDHSNPANAFDPSDRDGGIHIGSWPVRGLYLPDSIASYKVNGRTWLVTANEGDSRDYDGFAEEARVKDLTLDPAIFPNVAALRADAAIGRLTVTRTLGDTDSDGDYDAVYSLGARSFSIWNDAGQQVFDSGRAFEDLLAEIAAPDFNSDHAENGTTDTRSDNKGPEPEGVTLGEHKGRTYAFIGLERQSGIVVYDVSNPHQPVFVDYLNNRNFMVDTTLADGSVNPLAGDLGPEGLVFIEAHCSPTKKPLLVVGNEVSGTTTIYEFRVR